MKIALVCPYSVSRPGGVQGQVLGLAQVLEGRGHEVLVIAPSEGDPPYDFVYSVGGSVDLPGNGSVAPIAPDAMAMGRTRFALARMQPDVMHLHEPLQPGPTWVGLMSNIAPAIGTIHASGHSFYARTRPVARVGMRRLAFRTAVSEEARRLVQIEIGGAYYLLPNGVDVDRFDQAEPWPTTKPVILFVGRHEPRKGLAVMLDAFEGLDRDAELWVVGKGPQTEGLRARGVPNVVWLGEIDDAELARRMKAATIYCAPSRFGESFGVVLIEAMAARTPIVSTDIAGYREVARQGKEAILVPPDDADGLRDGLRAVLDSPELAAKLVEAGWARANEFSMDSLAQQYETLYEAAAAQWQNRRDRPSREWIPIDNLSLDPRTWRFLRRGSY
jgi:phosphatidylinositol alpha-mannosyltransferase